MKKFRFSLEGALRVREVELRAGEAKLRDLVAQQQRVRRSLDVIAMERREAAGYVQQHPADSLAVRALPGYFLGLDMRRANLARNLETLAGLIREQRGLVMELERKVKLLSRLREQRVSEWRKETEREIEATAQEAWVAAHMHAGKVLDR